MAACTRYSAIRRRQVQFEQVAEQARREDEDGEISPQTITKAKALVARLRSKLAGEPLGDPKDNLAAERFLKTLAGLVKLLEKPDTKAVLDELRKFDSVTVGSLIGFMHVYNLRFAAATTPKQKMIYEKLWPLFDNARDKVSKSIDGSVAVQGDPNAANDFFNKMDPDALGGKKKDAPKPPNPQE